MELGEYIFGDLEKNAYLLKLYTNLLKQYAIRQFKIDKELEIEDINIKDLLRFADLLSKSTNSKKEQFHKNIAQNIVILLKKLYPDNTNVTATFISVLNNINNYRNLDDEELYYESDIREFVYQYIEKQEFKIDISGDERYFIRDQKEIFNKLEKEKYFSYSGPTSMGKTFVIKMFIQKRIKDNKKDNFVVVVPTKALISEITSELINELGEQLKIKNYKVVNSWHEIQNDSKYNYIMIYTQERFLSHLLNNKMQIGYVFIDEAHKMFYEDTRSVYFYKIIDILNGYVNIPKIFFSAPLIANPDEFLKLLPTTLSKTYKVFEFSPVNQQKYIVDYDGKNIRIFNDLSSSFIELYYDKIDNFNLNNILKLLGNQQKNLVYCENPKEAIDLAKNYALTIDNKENNSKNDNIEKVKKYIKNEIHERYFLVDLLDKGIAYHVGYVPNSIRKKIEKLYREKEIDTIFCTSTLLEGINLPADNLFIPVKNKSKILNNDIDFKNLIGRVGRIKYNLSGNVFIIPKDGLKTVTDCTKMIDSEIVNRELSINKLLTDERKKDIVDNLKQGKTKLEKSTNNVELDFSRYIMNVLIDDIINDRKSNIVKSFEKYIDKGTKKKIIDNFKDAQIPQDMPVTLDQVESVNKGIDDELKYPTETNYQTILNFLEKLYSKFKWDVYEPKNELGNKNVLRYYATILNQWINGAYINQIIDNSIKEAEKKKFIYDYSKKIDYVGNTEQINIVINNTLDTIERIIQFKIENYFSKFSELYKKKKEIESIDNDWYEYLSYGTNKREIIELQKIGFSREIALKIYRSNKYLVYNDRSFSISTEILYDENEDIVEEANEVYLNNYNKFIEEAEN